MDCVDPSGVCDPVYNPPKVPSLCIEGKVGYALGNVDVWMRAKQRRENMEKLWKTQSVMTEVDPLSDSLCREKPEELAEAS